MIRLPPSSQLWFVPNMGTRRTERTEISVTGRYRRGTGAARDVEILDLTEEGCRFFDRFGRLPEGTEISLRIGPIGPLLATVRWRSEGKVGVQFEQPLYGPVFEHIRDQIAASQA